METNMLSNIVIYHSIKYDVSNTREVFAFYRHFMRNNSTPRRLRDMIEAGVFGYCDFNQLYFHRRSSQYRTVYNADGEAQTYYNGTYDMQGLNLRMCDYSGNLYIREDWNWLEFYSGEHFRSIHRGDVIEYRNRFFRDENEVNDWKERNLRYVSNYHSSSPTEVPFDDIKPEVFKVGFEAEKEDATVRNSVDIQTFLNDSGGYWRKESDSSLDSRRGFELISPIMDFNVERIERYINETPFILEHINAEYNSVTCGGHITVSEVNKSGLTVFENISGYVPILYAMYNNRLSNDYCRAHNKETLKRGQRSAINVKSACVEIRIFPAIRDMENLMFRLRLVRLMLDNPTNDTKAAIKVIRDNSALFSGIYSRENLSRMLTRAAVYAEDYDFTTNPNYAEFA